MPSRSRLPGDTNTSGRVTREGDMLVNPQLVRLDAELADLKQQLRAVDSRRDLSDGQKVLLRGGFRHELSEKHLEREILVQAQAVEASGQHVEGKRKRYDWAQTPGGLKALVQDDMRRQAGRLAFSGGTDRKFTSFDMLDPEQRVIKRCKSDLTQAEGTLRSDLGRLSDLRRQLRELKNIKQQPSQDFVEKKTEPLSLKMQTEQFHLDPRLTSPKLQALSTEMNHRADAEKRRINFEVSKSLNPAVYLDRLRAFHEKLTDEWVKRAYGDYCETWKDQNNSVTPAFIRWVRDKKI